MEDQGPAVFCSSELMLLLDIFTASEVQSVSRFFVPLQKSLDSTSGNPFALKCLPGRDLADPVKLACVMLLCSALPRRMTLDSKVSRWSGNQVFNFDVYNKIS